MPQGPPGDTWWHPRVATVPQGPQGDTWQHTGAPTVPQGPRGDTWQHPSHRGDCNRTHHGTPRGPNVAPWWHPSDHRDSEGPPTAEGALVTPWGPPQGIQHVPGTALQHPGDTDGDKPPHERPSSVSTSPHISPPAGGLEESGAQGMQHSPALGFPTGAGDEGPQEGVPGGSLPQVRGSGGSVGGV